MLHRLLQRHLVTFLGLRDTPERGGLPLLVRRELLAFPRTAEWMDQIVPRAYDVVSRERFYEACCDNVTAALNDIEGARARRRAEREAIFATMEVSGLIRRTRGRRVAGGMSPRYDFLPSTTWGDVRSSEEIEGDVADE